MSVICAKVYNNKIVIASDSIVVKGWFKNTKGDFVKLAKINEMVMGGCGDVAEQGLMWQYMKTHKPASANITNVLDFMAEFSKWKRDFIGSGSVQNSYLLVFEGKLFYIEDMFPIEINTFASIGAGMNFGDAAMYLGYSPREAVKVACELSCYVAEPIIEYVILK